MQLSGEKAERKEQRAEKQRRKNGDGDIPCAGDDAGNDAPEHEYRVHRVLDRRAEADDGERADHAEREDDVGAHRQNGERRDHGEHHK